MKKEDGGNEYEISKSVKEIVDSLIKETRIKVTIKKYARLGKKKEGNNKDRPILITLSDKGQVLSILKAFNQLKNDSKHKYIYMNKDLTEAARLKQLAPLLRSHMKVGPFERKLLHLHLLLCYVT